VRRVRETHEPAGLGEAAPELGGGARVQDRVDGQERVDGAEETLVRESVEEGAEDASLERSVVSSCVGDAEGWRKVRAGPGASLFRLLASVCIVDADAVFLLDLCLYPGDALLYFRVSSVTCNLFNDVSFFAISHY